MMNFGEAIDALKAGMKVARSGMWSGKGMFLYLNDGSAPAIYHELGSPGTINGVSYQLFELGDVGSTVRMPSINMREASQSVEGVVSGWLPSQTDMLAEDWEIITSVELERGAKS